MIKTLIYTIVLCSSLAIESDKNGVDHILKPMQALASGMYNYYLFNDLQYPEGEYYTDDMLKAEITLRNVKNDEITRRVDYSIYDWNRRKIDTVSTMVDLGSLEEKKVEMSWVIPNALTSGRYYSEIEIWQIADKKSDDTDSAIDHESGNNVKQAEQLLYRKKDEVGIKIFRQKEDFDLINKSIWSISSKRLGRSWLQPQNVKTENGYLTIDLPSGTLNGGEIYTKELQSYGIYEARMKLPRAPSSLTGFFFYLEPDYYYEIDIEVMNNSEGELYLTTYHDGSVSKTYKGKLGFDPTADFHLYRIEYQEKSLSFYIDDKKVREWKNGYPRSPMNLFINCWYPKWLEGRMGSANKKLYVDWIKY